MSVKRYGKVFISGLWYVRDNGENPRLICICSNGEEDAEMISDALNENAKNRNIPVEMRSLSTLEKAIIELIARDINEAGILRTLIGR